MLQPAGTIYLEMQATTTEWPIVDPQYVLNELKELPFSYETYKVCKKITESEKSNGMNETSLTTGKTKNSIKCFKKNGNAQTTSSGKSCYYFE